MFVAGGYNDDFGPRPDVEVIDFSGQGLTCTTPAPLPYNVYETSTLKTAEGNPLICGGQGHEYECREYIPEQDVWMARANLIYSRQYSPSVEIANNNYWIAGGFEIASTSELYIAESASFVEGPSIPSDARNTAPCAVRISDDLSFYAGQGSYIYDWTTATATPTATPIPAEAYGSICGLAIASSGEMSIVVAGGDFGSVLVYIYDLTEETWREALNPLPFDLWLSSVVPFGDTFLAVGGLRADGQRDDRILEYQPDDESWIVREERLSEPKSEMSVLFISEDKVSCS